MYGSGAHVAYNLAMPGKANIRKRKKAARGRTRAALQQELQAAEEKETAEFFETLEGRSRVAEHGSTMLVSTEGFDRLFENREP